jgi:hypothetical protein
MLAVETIGTRGALDRGRIAAKLSSVEASYCEHGVDLERHQFIEMSDKGGFGSI